MNVKVACILFILIFSSFFSVLSLTDSNYGDTCIYTLSGTRANDTGYYTQLCINYIQEQYSNHTIVVISYEELMADPDNTIYLFNTREEMTEETGITYTIVKVDIQLEEVTPDTFIVSINQATEHVEYGTSQIQNDYLEYIASLPPPYPKTDWWGTRRRIIEEIGYLPTTEVGECKRWYCTPKFLVETSNFTKLAEMLNNSCRGYNRSFNHPDFNSTSVYAYEMTLHDFLTVTNEDYVIYGRFLDGNILYQSDSPVNLYLIIVIVTGAVLVTMGIIFLRRKRKSLPPPES